MELIILVDYGILQVTELYSDLEYIQMMFVLLVQKWLLKKDISKATEIRHLLKQVKLHIQYFWYEMMQ